MNVDPWQEKYLGWSSYNYTMGNPVNYTDPTGKGPTDWVLNAEGRIVWDKNANSQESTKSGEKYLGKELRFKFKSYIDEELWDGPGGDMAAGVKLTSNITINASEDSDGNLVDVSASFEVVLGNTPVGSPRLFYPGDGGSVSTREAEKVNGADGSLEAFTIKFEQHASVSSIEESTLRGLGYNIVDVAQKLVFSYRGNTLWLGAYTNIFPSATLTVNGNKLVQYDQPSFEKTHRAPIKPSLTPPYYQYDFDYYPSKFYKR